MKTLKSVVFMEFQAKYLANRKVDRAVVIDVRTPGEFAAGHSPVALNIDIYSPEFVRTVDKLDRDDAYFIYCHSGNRSRSALKMFEQLGFKEAYDLKGGWMFNKKKILSLGADTN